MDINEQKKAIGERIKLIRKKRGETLEQFGNAIGGVLKSNVSKWERGQSLPNNERIKKISELGNVSVNYLLEGRYMLRDMHILSEEEQNNILIGGSIFDEAKKNIKPTILEVLQNDEIFTAIDWYFINSSISFIMTLHAEESIKIKLATYMNALTEIYLDDIPEEHLETEVTNLSKDLSNLPQEIQKLIE